MTGHSATSPPAGRPVDSVAAPDQVDGALGPFRIRIDLASTTGRMIMSGVGGALTGAAVRTGWWTIAILGLAAVAGATFGLSSARRVLVGTAGGVVHAAVTTLWALPFTRAGTVALILLQAAGWGLAALALTRRSRWPWPLAPALALSEWARTHWPLGGYPLAQLWLSQADGPLAAIAPLLGPFAITAAVVLLATASVGALRRRRAAIGVLVVSLVILGAAQLFPVPSPDAEVVVAAVQGGDRRGLPAARDDPDALFERQVALTRSLGTDVDVAVWPESAVVEGEMSPSEQELLGGLAGGFDGVLVVGLVERFDRAQGAG